MEPIAVPRSRESIPCIALPASGLLRPPRPQHPPPTMLAIVLTSQLESTKTPTESDDFAARLSEEQLQRFGAYSLANAYRAISYNTIRCVLQSRPR